MVKFNSDESLGKVVKKNFKLSTAIGLNPVKSLFEMRFAAGGNKFSQLCGFFFDTVDEKSEYPRFSISFVCKLRSKIYRQQNTNPSQWFAFRRINDKRVDVLDKKALLINYGFDVDKFFDSDLFAKAIPMFEKYLNKGLDDCFKFATTLKDKKLQAEATSYMDAIKQAIPLLSTPRINDKYYPLNDLDAIDPNAKPVIDAVTKKQGLEKALANITKGQAEYMSKLAAYSDKQKAAYDQKQAQDELAAAQAADMADDALHRKQTKKADYEYYESELDKQINEALDQLEY